MIGGFPVFAGALALVLGALVVGGEYGWGTLKTIFTQRPGRLQVMAGQLLGAGHDAGGVGAGIFDRVGAVRGRHRAAEGEPINWPGAGDAARGLASGWLVLMVWCLAGVALAVACRSVAMPIGLGVVWVLGVETLGGGPRAAAGPGDRSPT